MMKHDHNDFPSDIFLILETVAANFTTGKSTKKNRFSVITILVSVNGQESTLTPHDFIKSDMKLKILQNITLPEYTDQVKYISYKVIESLSVIIF